MLVKFQSSTDGSILMFADAAATLLGYLGKAAAPHGVLEKDDLPGLVDVLKALRDGTPSGTLLPGDAHAGSEAGRRDKSGKAADEPQRAIDASEVPVGLRQRVTPLLELMQRTCDNEGYILWEAPGGFGAGQAAGQ